MKGGNVETADKVQSKWWWQRERGIHDDIDKSDLIMLPARFGAWLTQLGMMILNTITDTMSVLFIIVDLFTFIIHCLITLQLNLIYNFVNFTIFMYTIQKHILFYIDVIYYCYIVTKTICEWFCYSVYIY